MLDIIKRARIDLMYLLNESQKFLVKFEREKRNIRKNKGNRDGRTKIKQKIEEIGFLKVIGLCFTAVYICIVFSLIVKIMMEEEVPPVFGFPDSISYSSVITKLIVIGMAFYFIFSASKKAINHVIQKISYRKHIKSKTEIEIWTKEDDLEELSP